ncbi:MAG TPA: ABC transporter permease [Gaiellaceae bacterium]|nr:ABC transporter permease [Gaiellaceae bacterium]
MATAARESRAPAARFTVAHQLRTLLVIAAADFKLKYAGSALGYVWSVVKPLALFTMLYLVFGRLFHLGDISPYYPVSLLMGIVLFYFFSDATVLGMNSIVSRSDLIRKISFPRMIVTVSATLTALLTLCVNLTVVAGFIAWKHVTPRWDWLLLVPLLLEFYVFTLGIALILATLFVRLRDVGQVWDLAQQLFMYATPIVYPVGYLPPWARHIAFLNPFAQVLQDTRSIVLYDDAAPNRITAANAFGTPAGDLIPIAVAVGIFLFGVALMKREEPWFAERV